MAGRKQHYIPQAVQRAFEASRSGIKSQVLVFRKGRPAYLTATEGSAAERDFYSNPLTDGKGALDDKITDFESDHLAPMLRKLRSVECGEVDADLAAITVAHLTFRTAHLRDAMATMADDALGQMQSLVEDPDAIRRFAGVDSMSPESTISETVRDELLKFGLVNWSEKDHMAFERIVVFRLRERFDNLVSKASDTMRNLLASLESNLGSEIPKAHARALSKSLVPQERVRALRELNWRVVAVDALDRHFILPDCVVAASSTLDGELQPLALLSHDEAARVVMPLSSTQLLVGSVGDAEVAQTEINRQLARCSLDFFISSKQDDATEKIAELIGACATDLKLDFLDENEGEVGEESPPVEHAARTLKVRVPHGRFGDAAKKTLLLIAADLIDSDTAHRIESVTVPASMKAELLSILKRDPTDAELQAVALGTVEPVKCEDEWKCRIILPRNVVEMLLNTSDHKKRLIATRVIKHNFGRAHYFDCWAQRYPAIFNQPSTDPWDQVVLRLAFRAASDYFGGIASARHEPEPLLGDNALQELATFINLGLAGLSEARQRFFLHRNVDQLIREVVQPIEIILTSIASVSGVFEAKDTSIARHSSAGVALNSAGLWEWSVLFSEDLRRHHERRLRWSSDAQLHELGRHVERLLWPIGVVVSQVDEGYWIDVLDDERTTLVKRALST